MQYVTNAERIGIKKGVEQGLKQGMEKGMYLGERAMTERQLIHRFGELPTWIEEHLSNAPTE